MPLLNFNHKPKNELEEGGRKTAGVTPDELQQEPVKTCPSCRKEIPEEAVRKMNAALCELIIEGIPTNVDQQIRIVGSKEFI